MEKITQKNPRHETRDNRALDVRTWDDYFSEFAGIGTSTVVHCDVVGIIAKRQFFFCSMYKILSFLFSYKNTHHDFYKGFYKVKVQRQKNTRDRTNVQEQNVS